MLVGPFLIVLVLSNNVVVLANTVETADSLSIELNSLTLDTAFFVVKSGEVVDGTAEAETVSASVFGVEGIPLGTTVGSASVGNTARLVMRSVVLSTLARDGLGSGLPLSMGGEEGVVVGRVADRPGCVAWLDINSTGFLTTSGVVDGLEEPEEDVIGVVKGDVTSDAASVVVFASLCRGTMYSEAWNMYFRKFCIASFLN